MTTRTASNNRQLSIPFPNRWGGKRKGAGRKRRASRKRVSHRTRPRLASRFPVHVTMRVKDDVRRLRNFKMCAVLRRAFVAGCKRQGFRICQFSVQNSHIHLVCEATSAQALSRGMQWFNAAVARGINGHLKRRGGVFADRYHEEIMKTPRQTRNTLCYVIQNARRHRVKLPTDYKGIDPFSSAWYFDGWKDVAWRDDLAPPGAERPVATARTWLLEKGWRRHGLITIEEVPHRQAKR